MVLSLYIDIDIDKLSYLVIHFWLDFSNKPPRSQWYGSVLGPAWRQAAPRLHLTFLASAVTPGR